MSYASSNKARPNLLKTIPQKVSQPTAIAVIASIGIHGLLGVSLPYLPISSQEKPKPVRNVQLLELSPQELSQLPPAPPPPLPLSPGLNQQLQPLPTIAPDLSASLSPLPPYPYTGLSSLPPVSALGSGIGSSASSSQRSNITKMGIADSPKRTDLPAKDPNEPALPPDRQAGKSTNSQPKTATGSGIITSPIFGHSGRDLGDLTGSQGLTASNYVPSIPDIASSNNTPVPGGTPSLFPKDSPPTTTASSSTATTQAVAPTSEQRNLPDDAIAIARANQDFLQSQEKWKNRYGDPKPLPLIISSRFPQKARTAGVDRGSVEVRWKVDKDGNIISDSLQVIGSTEGGVFDEEAIAEVRSIPKRATGKEEAYSVRVTFTDPTQYPATVPGSPTSTDGKKPTEQSTPTEQNKPSPRQTPSGTQSPTPKPIAPEGQFVPERSPQNSGNTPSPRPSASEQPTAPAAEKTPSPRPSASEQSTPPAAEKTPSPRPSASEQPTAPAAEKTPLPRPSASEQSTPPATEKTPSPRPSASEQLAPPPAEENNSPEPQNSEKPPSLPEVQSSEPPTQLREPQVPAQP